MQSSVVFGEKVCFEVREEYCTILIVDKNTMRFLPPVVDVVDAMIYKFFDGIFRCHVESVLRETTLQDRKRVSCKVHNILFIVFSETGESREFVTAHTIFEPLGTRVMVAVETFNFSEMTE